MNRTKGIFFAALSAILFGLSPTITGVIFVNGGNSLTIAFLRSLFSIPMLFVACLANRYEWKVTRRQAVEIALLGCFGIALTSTTLTNAYTYISGGLATTLHFIYPALTALCGWIFYKEKLSGTTIAALAIITAGVVLFSANTVKVQPLGIVLALVSGVSYTFYVFFLGHSHLQDVKVLVLSMYIMVAAAACTGVYGLATRSLDFASLNGTGWAFCAINAMVGSIIATTLFQLGVRYAGSTTTSMMSALEPATSVVCGFLIAKEVLAVAEIIGCAAVLLGILLLLPRKNEAMVIENTEGLDEEGLV